jgi:hypothetical protein
VSGRFLVVDQLYHHHSDGMAEGSGLNRIHNIVVEAISE